MAHVDESDRLPAFQKAIQERDRKNDAYFFDGVSEGRRRQRDDDEYAFEDRERYKAERNEALENISQFQIESHDAREQLRTVTEQLSTAQADCERLRQRVSILNIEKQDLANELQQVLKMEVQLQQMTKLDDQMLLDCVETITSQISPSQPSCMDSAPSSSVTELSDAKNTAPSHPTTTASTTYASVASSPPSNTSTAVAQRAPHVLPARPSGPVPALLSVDLRASAVQSTTSPSSISRSVKTLRQLQSLMAAAHKPGNEQALIKVKALCGEAHATPRELKSDLQRYLLSNWRNPTPSSSNGTASPPTFPPVTPTAPAAMLNRSRSSSVPGRGGATPSFHPGRNNPRIDDPVEIWYDYLCTYPSCCPRGVRRDARNRPHLPDLRASRIVARLRPEILQGSALHIALRADFMSRVVGLFSVPGAYAIKIKAGGLVVAPIVTYKAFNATANSNVCEEDVVRHFAQCGITVAVTESELEPWAMHYLTQAPVSSSSG